MKKTGKALISVLVIALLLCAVSTTALAAAGTPSLSASAESADPGQTVTFTLTPNNPYSIGDYAVDGPLTFQGISGVFDSTATGFLSNTNAPITFTYVVNADAAPGTTYTFTVTGLTVTDDNDDEFDLGSMSTGGTVAGEVPVPPADEPVAPAVSSEDGEFSSMTLPAGTTYYTMVNGAPGASRTLNKTTTVSVIEKMPNGYTKIMMGTTTYLIKSSKVSSSASNSKLDSVPKTADATSTTWTLALMTIAAASAAAIFALKKVTAK